MRRPRLARRQSLGLVAAWLCTSCDLPPTPTAGEAPTVVAISPSEGSLARDGHVEIVLDRLIEPASLIGADASLRSGERELGVGLAFDPVSRVLVADPTARLLDPDLDYTLRVSGPRAFDGTPLAPVEHRLRVTRDLEPPPAVPSYDEVLAVLDGCRSCHEGPTAALGLDVRDLAGTAIGVPASEVSGAAFGRGLGGIQRIEPGHPERSYLVYKMLGEGPIVGAPMGDAASPDTPLARASIALLSRWIAAGARVPPREQP